MGFDFLAATPAEIALEAERRRIARANGTLDELPTANVPEGWRGTPERARELGLTKSGKRSLTEEHDAQVDVFKWIDGEGVAEWPELRLAYAVPNGGHRRKSVAAKLKAEGVRAGMPDIVVPVPRGPFGSLCIEMKTPTGRVRPVQRERGELLAVVGNKCLVCRSGDDAIEAIRQYMRLTQPIVIGRKYGRLTVLAFSHTSTRRGDGRMWKCACDCGTLCTVRGASLKNGNTRSCGCLSRETTASRLRKHGMKGSPEYVSWCGAKDHCFNQGNKKFADYGGRGITMCEEWRNSFAAFYRDMGPRPPNTSLDRINNNGNYEAGNCRWSTAREQARNKRPRTCPNCGYCPSRDPKPVRPK